MDELKLDRDSVWTGLYNLTAPSIGYKYVRKLTVKYLESLAGDLIRHSILMNTTYERSSMVTFLMNLWEKDETIRNEVNEFYKALTRYFEVEDVLNSLVKNEEEEELD